MSYDPIAERVSWKDRPNGYASLNTNGTIPLSILPVVSSTLAGIVPDPGAVAGSRRFLSSDGTWEVPKNGGIVAGVDLLNQTSSISTTTLISGTTGGTYTIYVYVSITTAGTSGFLAVTFNWTYAGVSSSNSVNVAVAGAGNYASSVFSIRLESSDNLQYSTSYTGTAGAVEWNLRFSVVSDFQ